MMINICPPVAIDKLSRFLEEMNNKSESHIGYCGEVKSEIYHTLLNHFSDLDLSRSFAVAYDKDEIIGALGFDIDLENRSAEVWGPFIKNGTNYPDLANNLWEELNLFAQIDIQSYSFFVNKANMLARQFVLDIEANENGKYLILKSYRNELITTDYHDIIKYDSSYKSSFIGIHTTTFTHTYLKADEILERICEENQLLIIKDTDEKIKGYVYVEADPRNGEGTIEYIAVSPDYRKQGIGKRLIKAALAHLFSYEEIEEITLCVGFDNEKAIHLYKASGFHELHELISYVKK